MSKAVLSRRDFLKLSGYGFMGIFLPDLPSHLPQQDDFASLQGRIIDRTVWTFDEPNSKAKRAKLYWHDLVIPITNTTIGDDEAAYNRVWYQLDEGGYAYSGSIRYRLLDDKFEQYYYVPARHIRLLSTEELTPLSPNVPDENKHLEVRLNDQLLLAYENTQIVFATRVSSGGKRLSGKYTTPVGNFITYHKRPTRHMAAGDIASNGFDLPGVPWVLYITEGGISFHGTYWHNDFGHSHSHGCINLAPQAAKWLFRWTRPTVPPEKPLAYGYVGTQVEIKV